MDISFCKWHLQKEVGMFSGKPFHSPPTFFPATPHQQSNKSVTLHRLTRKAVRPSGCSSARLEYTSGGRVVAGSNPVTPTEIDSGRGKRFFPRPDFFCANGARSQRQMPPSGLMPTMPRPLSVGGVARPLRHRAPAKPHMPHMARRHTKMATDSARST